MLHTLPKPPTYTAAGFEAFPVLLGSGIILAALVTAGIILHGRIRARKTVVQTFTELRLTIGIVSAVLAGTGLIWGIFLGACANSAANSEAADAWAKTFVADVHDQYEITLTPDTAVKLSTRQRVDAVVDGRIVELQLVPTANDGYVLTANGAIIRKAH